MTQFDGLWRNPGFLRFWAADTVSVFGSLITRIALPFTAILMLNASDDEVIPRPCTDALWTALGQPPIKWYSGGHYSVVWHLFGALWQVGRFFAAE